MSITKVGFFFVGGGRGRRCLFVCLQYNLDIDFGGPWNLRICHCKRAVKSGIASHTCALILRSTQSLHCTLPGIGVPENTDQNGPKDAACKFQKAPGVDCQGAWVQLQLRVCCKHQLLALKSSVLTFHLLERHCFFRLFEVLDNHH